MLEKKKKLSKKELKEDKLVTSYYKAIDIFEERKQQIIIAAAAVIIIVVGVYMYQTSQKESNLAATTELSRVIPIIEQGQFQEAVEGQEGTNNIGLIKIVDQYGGTEQGEIARIYLGNSYFNLGNIDAAMAAYEAYSGSNLMFKSTALAGTAACYANKKEYSKAAGFYEKAAKVSKFNASNPQYLLLAGINYTLGENNKDAEKMFQTIKDEYKNSAEARDIDRYFAKLKI